MLTRPDDGQNNRLVLRPFRASKSGRSAVDRIDHRAAQTSSGRCMPRKLLGRVAIRTHTFFFTDCDSDDELGSSDRAGDSLRFLARRAPKSLYVDFPASRNQQAESLCSHLSRCFVRIRRLSRTRRHSVSSSPMSSATRLAPIATRS
jgi:hypothetical protein